MGHHGSKYATSDKLLKTIKPQYALISCGINNRYGHPHSETLERLEDNNCKVYVTNTLGEIIIRRDGYKKSVHQYLQYCSINGTIILMKTLNDNIKKGLKSISDEIAFSEECKLIKSEITSIDEREVIIPPIFREIEAKVLPSLTTIMPPFIFLIHLQHKSYQSH